MKAICKCGCGWFFNFHLEGIVVIVCNKCKTPYKAPSGDELRELKTTTEDRYYLNQLSTNPNKLVEYWGFTVVALPTAKISLLDTLIML